MNEAEKLASTYLRLNGFLLLPHFTTFMGEDHNHVDFVGLRPPGSEEIAFASVLPTDPMLFKVLSDEIEDDAKARPVGIIAEVRTSKKRDEISQNQVEYVQSFLGGLEPIRVTFFSSKKLVERDRDGVVVGLQHAGRWIDERITWMEKKLPMSKTGSWNWSEEALGEILARRRLAGRYKKKRR